MKIPTLNTPGRFLVNQFQLVYSGPMTRRYVAFLLLIASITLLACGAAEAPQFATDREMAQEFPRALAAEGQMMMTESEGLSDGFDTAVPQAMAESMEMAAAPAAAPAPTLAPAQAAAPAIADSLPSMEEVQASVSAQERIIVRTVGMGLVVDNVADKVDRVGAIASELGGWTVTSDRGAIHHGNVSVRVPAQQLDDAVRRIRALAIRVEFESSTSQDVTDEYVDTSSRLRSLRATEESLLNLLAQATDVEDALDVQRELSQLQSEIESLEGRINFLQQTAAYSLINVNLTLAPRTMTVNSGPDQTYSAGQPARFRATFEPPEGIDSFNFIWDFGDGATIEGRGSAPTTQPGQRVTATVTHFFEDDRDSPYIVQLDITGTGEAGLAEGSDTLIATVTRVPTIEVFAGESRLVEEGDEVEYGGSFTRPEGLWDLEYRWDFGDGSPTVIGAPEEGDTRVTAVHTYENYRPQPYEVTLTVTAQSDAGEVKGSSSFYVDVNESQGLVVGNWDLVESSKWAIRALSAVALAVVNILIWVVIFSPVWLALGAAVYGLYRLNRFRKARRDARRSLERTAEGTSEGTETSAGAMPPGQPSGPAGAQE